MKPALLLIAIAAVGLALVLAGIAFVVIAGASARAASRLMAERQAALPLAAPDPRADPDRTLELAAVDEDITLMTFRVDVSATPTLPPGPPVAPVAPGPPTAPPPTSASEPAAPTLQRVQAPTDSLALPIVVDDEAIGDEPTGPLPLVLVSGVARTDRGLRRKRNEDSFLAWPEEYLFVVADGMGGYAGGEVASRLAVETIEAAYRSGHFEGGPFPDVPKEASDLAKSIHMANRAIRTRAVEDATLAEMGTTVVAARFSPRKNRVYFGHVGDSRAYRLRDGRLRQLSTDHTLRNEFGVTGKQAEFLTRAVGVDPGVRIDVIIARHQIGDIYLICSDGLSKMANSEDICSLLQSSATPEEAAQSLVARALAGGGRDNVTVIVIQVEDILGTV